MGDSFVQVTSKVAKKGDGFDGFGAPDPFNQNDDDQVDQGEPNAPDAENPNEDANMVSDDEENDDDSFVQIASKAALVAPVAVAKSPPLAAKKVQGHVTLSVDQQKTMHSGCVSACKPSPVESKCVTACEVAMYKCIDETGPNETPKDTKACSEKALKLYEETKGIEKK